MENKILNDDGLLAGPSVPTESEAAAEDSILDTDSEEDITSAQKQRSPDAPKRRRDERPRKSPPRKRKLFNPRDHEVPVQPMKKPRQNTPETTKEIKEKIKKSEESIAKLKAHTEKGTCPKTLRYTARANIAPDEDFKKDISSIRKDAQKKYLDALTKFHYRRIETFAVKLRKLEQLESRRKTNDVKLIKNRRLSTKEHADRIEQIQKKMSKLNEEMMLLEKEQNKKDEPYRRVLSVSANAPKTRKGRAKHISTKKRRERKRKLQHDIAKKTTESKKKHIRNLSDYNLTRDQINLLSRGLKYIPTPVTNKSHIRKELFKDFATFARRMRLQFIFHGQNKEPHPFHVKSNWEPPIQPSVALETYLEEVKIQLAGIQISEPKNNLPTHERLAIKELKENPNINIKKADKGTSTVIMNKKDKIHEGQIQLDVRENYKALSSLMVSETHHRVTQLIKALHHDNHIDTMTEKWLLLTQNPPRIPIFYTLTKIHKPNPVGRPIISGCEGPTERISSFLDYLLQPIAKAQKSYLKDTTDFINFIEKTKVEKNAVLVSMDVTSLYTNIPQEEGIATVCNAYETFHKNSPPIPTHYIREMLNLILKENSFEFNGKHYLQTHGTAMGTRVAVAFANIFMSKIETEIILHSSNKPLVWKRYLDDIFSLWNIDKRDIGLFLKLANNYHPTIKFTAEISDKEITFLDTCVYKGERFKRESILDVRTHFKPTETFQYTEFTSCHPPGVWKGFIKGKALRLLRTNSSERTFEENIIQFKRRLRARGYPDNLSERILSGVKFSERMSALQNKQKTHKRILPFVTEYRPSVPNLKNILMKKWHLIENQPVLKEIFKDPPILSYRKGRSLKDILVRAKI